MTKRFALLIASLSFFIATVSNAMVVVVQPVEVFNAPEVAATGAGLQSVLASRLASPRYEVRTSAEAGGDGDWIVKTTITHLGGTFSVDGVLTHARGEASGERTFETVPSKEKLMDAISKVAARFKDKLVGYAPAASDTPSVAPPPPVAVAAPTPVQIQSAPAEASSASSAPLANYSLIGSFKGEGLSLSVAGLDGDSMEEMIVLVDEKVVVFREDNGGITEVFRAALDLPFTPMLASAGDLGGDGSVELFIAGAKKEEARSQGYRITSTSMTPVGGTVNGFLRIVAHPVNGDVLTGIPAKGGSSVFGEKVYEYEFAGSTPTKGAHISTPSDNVPVNFDWIASSSTGQVNLAFMDRFDHIRIYDAGMSLLYKTDEVLKGGRRFIEGKESSGQQVVESARIEINGPTVQSGDLIVVHDNQLSPSLFTRKGSYDKSLLRGYKWDGFSLMEVATSAQFHGFINSVALYGGGKKVCALLAKDKGFFSKEYTTSILLFDL